MNLMLRVMKWLAILCAGFLAVGVLTVGSCKAIEPFLRPPQANNPDGPPPSGVPPVPQLLSNPGFERHESAPDTPPAPWSRDLDATAGKGTVTLDPTTAASGNRSLRLRPNTKNDNDHPLAVSQIIDANGLNGRTLEFEATVRTAAGTKALVGVLGIVDGVPSDLEIASLPPGTDWTKLAGKYRVPADGAVRLAFICMVNGTSGSAWFDDVRLGEPATAPPEQVARDNTALRASVRVDTSEVIREIPRQMFGTNIEWRWDGNFVWDEQEQQLDPEMVRLTRDLGVSVIRYPGGVYSDFYHWRDGVGPRDQRPVVQHEPGLEDRSRPNFGTDEALEFADRVGAELMITVNAGTGTPQEAADWVRYVNRDRLRVRLWEVGNELYINNDSVFTSAVTTKPADYAERFLEFAKAMKEADPRIKIGAIGGENQGGYRILSYPKWNRIVMKRAGHAIDFLSVHNAYAPVLDRDPQDVRAVYKAMMGAPTNTARNLDTIAKQIKRFIPDRADEIFIAVTEWGPFFRPGWDSPYIDHHKTLGSAIYAASVFKALLESKQTKLAAFWHLSDVSVLGWIGSTNNRFPADPAWAPTAKYMMFRLFSEHFGNHLVRTTVDSPTFTTPTIGYTDGTNDAPYLEALSSLDESGEHLYIIAINRDFDRPLAAQFNINGFVPNPQGTARTLTGTALDANTGTVVIKVPGLVIAEQAQDPTNPRFFMGAPGEITMTTSPLDAARTFEIMLPRLSVTSIELVREH